MSARGGTINRSLARSCRRPVLGTFALLTFFLLLCPAGAQAATPPPVTFNLQAAVDACPAGGTVNIPAGTITLSSPVWLKSGITVKGAGVGQTVLYMPGNADGGAIMGSPSGLSNVTIADMTMRSDSPEMQCFGIWISNYSNITIERVQMEGMFYALKADTRGSNLTIRDFTARDCGQVYISRLTKGRFYNLDLQMVTRRLASFTMHAIYLEGGSSDLQFYNCRAAGGSGWTVQLYQETQPTSGVLFDGLTVSGFAPICVCSGFSNITFKNLSATSTQAEVIWIPGGTGVTVDGFTARGPDRLVNSTGSGNVFRNGTYQGPSLGNGVTFENVTRL